MSDDPDDIDDGDALNREDFGKLIFASHKLKRPLSPREQQILRRVTATGKPDAELYGRMRTWLRGAGLDVDELFDYDIERLESLEWEWGVPPELALRKAKTVQPKSSSPSYTSAKFVKSLIAKRDTSSGGPREKTADDLPVVPTLSMCLSQVKDLSEEVSELRDFCFKIVAQNRSLKKMIEDMSQPKKTRRTKK